MENLKTEMRELWKITKFFSSVVLGLAFGWLVIVASWAIFGN